MVVMDESACMVDVAKYFMRFLSEESCGKCVPCRLGTDRMLKILTDFCEGRGRMDQIDTLQDLAWTMSNGSLCALGKTASNPVLSTLNYFRNEYEAHIKDRHCPAGVCQGLLRYSIDPDVCTSCGTCADVCPHGAVADDPEYRIDQELCERCGICMDECPAEAIIRA